MKTDKSQTPQKSRKLTLSKESLRNLSPAQLVDVAGATGAMTLCGTLCNCQVSSNCSNVINTCGTNTVYC